MAIKDEISRIQGAKAEGIKAGKADKYLKD